MNMLISKRQHLVDLLEAIRRCAWFLNAADRDIVWPLNADMLVERKKDRGLFDTLSTINERFAKLQDTIGSAMRHAAMLASEPVEPFLKSLAFYEKIGVLESIVLWQQCRFARNEAAHTYDTDYDAIAKHFNTLHELHPALLDTAIRFEAWCGETLDITPTTDDFKDAFQRPRIVQKSPRSSVME